MNTETTPATDSTETKTETAATTATEKPERQEPDNSRDRDTVLVPRVKARRNTRTLAYVALAFFAGTCALPLYRAFTWQKSDTVADTSVTRGVFSSPPQRKLKEIDATKCRRDQIHIVDNTLVTDSDCTKVVYEDDSK